MLNDFYIIIKKIDYHRKFWQKSARYDFFIAYYLLYSNENVIAIINPHIKYSKTFIS